VDETDILAKVRQVGRIDIKESDLEVLKKAGAGPVLLAELRRRLRPDALPLAERVYSMLKRGESEERLLLYILGRRERVRMSADDILRLRRAGATKRVLRAMGGDFVFAGYKLYSHPFSLFEIQLPEGWSALEVVRHGKKALVLSPSRAVDSARDVARGVVIEFYGLDSWSRSAVESGPVAYLERARGSILSQLGVRDPRVRGAATRTFLAGYDAGLQELDATVGGVRCAMSYVTAFPERKLHVTVRTVAPKGELGRFAGTFGRILATLRLFVNDRTPVRRARPVDRVDFLERYRESVVLVKAYFGNHVGFGTGFFVREDGLLLTNHHVVHDSAGQAAKHLEVIWDAAIEKPDGQANRSMPAVLLDSARGSWPLLDVAVLRVEQGRWRYKPIPLCRVGSGLVREEDEVLALGFPYPTSFKKIGRLIPTNGHLSRINHLADVGPSAGRLDDAVLDITINKGNSGGPCIDLRTGAVIGLNTQIVLAPGLKPGELEKLEYGRVCLIDHALRRFPQLRWYPQGQALSPEAHVGLAALLLAWGSSDAAWRELEIVRPRVASLPRRLQARYHFQSAVHADLTGRSGYFEAVREAHRLAPDDTEILAAYAYACGNLPQTGLGLVKRWSRLEPESWRPQVCRAFLLERQDKTDEALAAMAGAHARGAGYHPSYYRRTAELLVKAKRVAEAEKLLRQGLERAPHFAVRAALAKLYAGPLKNPGAARRTFLEALRRHPAEPRLHEDYGVFLAGLGQDDAAIKHLLMAVRHQRQRRGRPSSRTLTTICRIACPNPASRYSRLGLQAALLLAKRRDFSGPYWLREYWDKRGRREMAAAHGKGGMLGLADLDTMVKSGYSPGVAGEAVKASNINATGAELQANAKSWPRWFTLLVRSRVDADQIKGSRRFARFVGMSIVGSWRRGADKDDGLFRITNSARVPLTGVRMLLTYQDKDRKDLWTGGRDLPGWFLPLEPGRTVTNRIFFHDHETLRGNGVDPAKVAWVKWEPYYAHNATFLRGLRSTVRIERQACIIRIRNVNRLAVTRLRLRCDYLRDGAPVKAKDGTPFRADWRPAKDLVVGPNRTSAELRIKEWVNAEWLGLGSLAGVTLSVRVVDARLSK